MTLAYRGVAYDQDAKKLSFMSRPILNMLASAPNWKLRAGRSGQTTADCGACLCADVTLVTANVSEFERVRRLRTETGGLAGVGSRRQPSQLPIGGVATPQDIRWRRVCSHLPRRCRLDYRACRDRPTLAANATIMAGHRGRNHKPGGLREHGCAGELGLSTGMPDNRLVA